MKTYILAAAVSPEERDEYKPWRTDAFGRQWLKRDERAIIRGVSPDFPIRGDGDESETDIEAERREFIEELHGEDVAIDAKIRESQMYDELLASEDDDDFMTTDVCEIED